MKTPISYYGGKQLMVKTILPLIPKHEIYCEPFSGGAAVFFAKEPARLEIINDLNGELVNFYQVLKDDFEALQREVSLTLHSRLLHKQARVVYNNPGLFDRVKRAWALWMLANCSFNRAIDAIFAYDRRGDVTLSLYNKRKNFTAAYTERLGHTLIECDDALKIIKRYDNEKAFFYADPPYAGSAMGHYKGYTQKDFDALLETLGGIKGKFLLSSYMNDELDDFTKKHGWHTLKIEMRLTVNVQNKSLVKTEVLTANYPISTAGGGGDCRHNLLFADGACSE